MLTAGFSGPDCQWDIPCRGLYTYIYDLDPQWNVARRVLFIRLHIAGDHIARSWLAGP